MHIVFLTHPAFLGSQSMPRFAAMLVQGMQQRGHQTEIWTPKPIFYKLPIPNILKKWAGYIDQYIVFPAHVRRRLKSNPANTLFVFTDHALGPWVPLLAHRPHVIHCHDFLAQRSALGQIPENPTSSSGQQYQAYIRKGYQKGKNFISVSERTRTDLHEMLGYKPTISEMVYNGLNQDFEMHNTQTARMAVSKETDISTTKGYLLHVGGNQWYKNRTGVIQAYNAWRSNFKKTLPLLMVGIMPNSKLMDEFNKSPYKQDIHFLTDKSDAFIKQVYSGASVFFFPSLAEGFGWPIAEAMASGSPVITTHEAPMTEVGGTASFYVPRKQYHENIYDWAIQAASKINEILNLTLYEREEAVAAGVVNARRFDTEKSLNAIEDIYKRILSQNIKY